jgi:transcriptional regulator with XRE-family HTH domain
VGKGTPISQELKENIADDLALGYSFADIADRYGVSYSTIRRVKNNSPEAVPTPIEPASEEKVDTIDTSIIPDVKTEPDCDGQQRTETDCGGQTEQPNNSRQLDYERQSRTVPNYEEQREYITDILKATLEDIEEEIRSFEERIQTLTESLEERRQKQAYIRDFIRGM